MEQTSPLIKYYEEKGILRTEEVSIKINHLGKDVAEEVAKDISNIAKQGKEAITDGNYKIKKRNRTNERSL